MNLIRLRVPMIVLLALMLRPCLAAGSLDVSHNTNASSATSGEPPADAEENGPTPNGHVLEVATSHCHTSAHGRWSPGSLESGITLGLYSDPSRSAGGQGADILNLRADDLVFSSSDPHATQAVVQMHVHVTWEVRIPEINCGDVNDCNIQFIANTGAGGFVDGLLGSAGCTHAFCGQPASGSADFVTPAATVDLNSPFSPSFALSTMSRVQLCAGDFRSSSVAMISMSFPDPVFDLPPGVTVDSPDLGIVNNHWIGTTGCAALLGNPANASVAVGSPASFAVMASGADTLYFRWFHDGVALTDGGTISGTTTSTLSISSAAVSDSGLYTVTLENGCSPDTSAPARLTVTDPAGVAKGAEGAGLQRARLSDLGRQPAAGRMTFTLQMPRPGRAALRILAPNGQLVSVIDERAFPLGNSQITWDGRSMTGDPAPSGVYLVQLLADGVGVDVHKVVLIR